MSSKIEQSLQQAAIMLKNNPQALAALQILSKYANLLDLEALEKAIEQINEKINKKS